LGLRMKILLGQLSPKLGDVEGNLRKISDTLDRAEEADLAIFPELSLRGYTLKDMFFKLAMIPDEDPYLEKLRNIAEDKRTGVVVGFPEKSPSGYLYNSLIAIQASGEEMIYRKRHLPTFSVFDECRWFKPHLGSLRVWRLNDIGVSFGICYDIFFPEIFRAYSLMGAKILIIISASPEFSVPLFEKVCQARALENTCFLFWVNQVGSYDDIRFGGGSMAVSPLGEIIARCSKLKEDPRIVEIDLSEVERARYSRPVLRDVRREDAEQLLEAYLSREP